MEKIPDIVKDGMYFIYEKDGQYVAIYAVIFGWRVIAGKTKDIKSSHDKLYCCKTNGGLINIIYMLVYSLIDQGGDIADLPNDYRPHSDTYSYVPEILELVNGFSKMPEKIPFDKIIKKEVNRRIGIAKKAESNPI